MIILIILYNVKHRYYPSTVVYYYWIYMTFILVWEKYMSKRKHSRLFITTLVIIILLLIGILWQSIMTNKEIDSLSAPGSFVNVDSYDMHYVSEGNGDTAVVFIAGSGTPCAYTDFYNLQKNFSSNYQTISFDHAGSGWSTKTSTPRSIENLSEELGTMLRTVAKDKSVILICHSLGSLEAIYYARQNPDTVKGIVFLDSGSPEFYATDSEISATLLNRGTSILRTTGLIRLLNNMDVEMPIYGENLRANKLPAEIKSTDIAMFCRYAGNPETLKSINLINENATKLLENTGLGSIPILVISSDSGENWNSVQNELAGWSDNSTQITIENASH